MQLFVITTLALVLATANGNAVSQEKSATLVAKEITDVNVALTDIKDLKNEAEKVLGAGTTVEPAEHSGEQNPHKATSENINKAADVHKDAAKDYRATARTLEANGQVSVAKLFDEAASLEEDIAKKMNEVAEAPVSKIDTEGSEDLRELVDEQETKERELSEEALDLATIQRASAAKVLADVQKLKEE